MLHFTVLQFVVLQAYMLKGEATVLDDPFAALDDDNNELDANELIIDDVNSTETAKHYAVSIFMVKWMRIFTLH